ncbi:MAG: hypothetical protein IJ587_05065 [Synergistaceae bacterium]|nr:hypothetical protein [Synergistaceae bacterium]
MPKVCNLQSSNVYSVKNYTSSDDYAPLFFSFAQFKLKPVRIDGEFNNFFKDDKHYIENMFVLLGLALPLLSKENATLFSSDFAKAGTMHIHKVYSKRNLIERILTIHGFSPQAIDNIFEGNEIYQLEVPYLNGATRVIFQRIDNLLSFLFLDTNHHLYLNEIKTSASHSLFYEFCPTFLNNECNFMKQLQTCYAFEFLDVQKISDSLGYKYTPIT